MDIINDIEFQNSIASQNSISSIDNILNKLDAIENNKPLTKSNKPKINPDGTVLVPNPNAVDVTDLRIESQRLVSEGMNNILGLLQTVDSEFGNTMKSVLVDESQSQAVNFDYDNDYNENPDEIFVGSYSEDDIENESIPELAVPTYIEPEYSNPVKSNAKKTPVDTSLNYIKKTGMWGVVEESLSGFNSIKAYKVISMIDNKTVILKDIMLKETAIVLANELDKGKTLNEVSLLGIIGQGISYTNVINESICFSTQRGIAVNEKNYHKAAELDDMIEEKKKEAIMIKENVLNSLRNNGYL